MSRFTLVIILFLLPFQLRAQKNYVYDFGYYVGGSGYEQVRDITTDDSGNIYLTGGTASDDFPTTPGAYSRKLNVGGDHVMDAFVMKLNKDGRLAWATLFGGPEYDRAYAIEIDREGFVYIAGRAGKGLPVTNAAFQKEFAGDNDVNRLYGPQDGFIAKFSPDGSQLVWCSYFGAPDRGFIRDLALDSNDDIYIVATEISADYPFISRNAIQKQRKGGYEGIVARIGTHGDRVIWATYLGGKGDDLLGPSIKINSKQHVVVCGTTNSNDMMVTEYAFDQSFNGMEDVYVAAISNDGSQLLLGTYLGGSGSDGTETHNLAIDNADHIIVAATTSSEDFPVGPGVFQAKYGGSGKGGSGLHTNYPFDGFVAKLSADGAELLAATYLGGKAGEGLEGIDTDKDGNIYCAGSSFSKEIALSNNDTVKTKRAKAEQILACLDKDLKHALFFSFLGGESTDFGRTLCLDSYNNILIGGETLSENFPAANTFYGGPQDGILSRFRLVER